MYSAAEEDWTTYCCGTASVWPAFTHPRGGAAAWWRIVPGAQEAAVCGVYASCPSCLDKVPEVTLAPRCTAGTLSSQEGESGCRVSASWAGWASALLQQPTRQGFQVPAALDAAAGTCVKHTWDVQASCIFTSLALFNLCISASYTWDLHAV